MTDVFSAIELRGDAYNRGLYKMYACTFVHSLAVTNPGVRLNMFVDGMDKSDIDDLKTLADGISLKIIHPSKETMEVFRKGNNHRLGVFASLRCYLHRYFSGEGIWIDTDAVVCGKLDDLMADGRAVTQENDTCMAGSIDYSIALDDGDETHRGFINSGVLYLNFDRLKETGTGERWIRLCEDGSASGDDSVGKNGVRAFLADQDSLNRAGVSLVSPVFNVQRMEHFYDNWSDDELVKRLGGSRSLLYKNGVVYHYVGPRAKATLPYCYGRIPDRFFLMLRRVCMRLGPKVLAFDDRNEFFFRMTEAVDPSMSRKRLGVFFTTLDRTADACMVAKSYLEKLKFSGETRFFIVTEKERESHNNALRAVFRLHGRENDLELIEIPRSENTLGRALNEGLKAAFSYSNIVMRSEDDWYLHRPFGLDMAYTLLENDANIFQIKLATFERENFIQAKSYGCGMFEKQFSVNYWCNAFNMQCALVHRRAYDKLGWYAEDTKDNGINFVEPDMSNRFNDLTDRGKKDSPVVLWPYHFPKREIINNKLPFVHIGRSHHYEAGPTGVGWMFPVPPELKFLDNDEADKVIRAVLGDEVLRFRDRWPPMDPRFL